MIQRILSFLRDHFRFIILILFGTCCVLLSFGNHYYFRTHAFDLGIFNNAIYQYAHFQSNQHPLARHLFSSFLADHFSLYTLLLSPLYWVLGSYTLLVVQVAGILFGAYGIYVYVKSRTAKKYLPEIAMFHYLSFFGIYSALSFDYHDNVVGAMLLPWFLHYFQLRNTKLSLLFFTLILIAKENMALWMVFICAGLVLMSWKDTKLRNRAALLAFISMAYLAVVLKIVMPALDPRIAERGYHHFKYSVLGSEPGEIIHTIFTRPGYLLKLLFDSHSAAPESIGIKRELQITLLLSGSWILLLRPQYLIMLIPVFAQKLYSDDIGKWGINYQYSIEFIPVISIALFEWLGRRKSDRLALSIGLCAAGLTAVTTYLKLEHRVSFWYNPLNGQFYRSVFYTSEFDREAIFKAYSLIPENAAVSAQSQLIPRLAFRKKIYLFPDVYDAEYIMLVRSWNTYPFSNQEYEKKINELLGSAEWETLYNHSNVFLFKRK